MFADFEGCTVLGNHSLLHLQIYINLPFFFLIHRVEIRMNQKMMAVMLDKKEVMQKINQVMMTMK